MTVTSRPITDTRPARLPRLTASVDQNRCMAPDRTLSPLGRPGPLRYRPAVDVQLPPRIISADSHVTEPPDTYLARIDPAFRDRAPHLVHHDTAGDLYVIPGMSTPLPMGLVAAAGKPAEEIRIQGTRFEDLHRGG